MAMFDLAVIGGGPGGYHCAQLVAATGKSVVLFEKRSLGGTCLNEGCVPTKALLNCAKLYRHAMEGEAFGVTAENVRYDHSAAMARKNATVKTLVNGVAAGLMKHNVRAVSDHARLDGRCDGGFRIVTGGGETFEAARVVIASGSETVIPPVEGLKEGLQSGFVVTNREFLDMTGLPESVAVIGGGVIGLEMACFMASVGVSVTVVEMMPKIAGATDADACAVLQSAYEKQGMRFLLDTKVMRVETDGLVCEKDGKTEKITCGRVLLSAGRRASTAGLGLETLQIETQRGAIVTDRHLCTNVAGVYAVGDCNGKLMLAHTAYREAEVVANIIAGKKDEMRYEHIPSVLYTAPEVASVGETRASAEQKGMKVKEIKVPMAFSGRFVAESADGLGFAKILLDRLTDRLVGVVIVGPYASEMILSAEMMLDTQLPPEQLKKLVFPHPTVGEVLKEALFRV